MATINGAVCPGLYGRKLTLNKLVKLFDEIDVEQSNYCRLAEHRQEDSMKDFK